MARPAYGAAVAFANSERSAAPAREFEFSEDDFHALSELAYQHAGIVLSDSKRNLVYSRLSRRLRVLDLETFRDYRAVLESETGEVENFINSISTNHTKFFREDHHFKHFRAEVVLPLARSAERGPLRVWSAGCSTGEEPYTLAVVLKRELRNLRDRDVRILATDIDTDVLTKAARGDYPPAALNDVPTPYHSLFKPAVVGGESKVVLDDDARDAIAFRRLNLMEPWPFRGLFDAIFCRNVMIYFDAQTKATLIDRFVRQLKPGGWLYIGHSESLTGIHSQLRSVGRTIYRRAE
ncbi:MAG: CheR family methyltransferase [Pseudolabrys sp.]